MRITLLLEEADLKREVCTFDQADTVLTLLGEEMAPGNTLPVLYFIQSRALTGTQQGVIAVRAGQEVDLRQHCREVATKAIAELPYAMKNRELILKELTKFEKAIERLP
jgi:hypothetical protein